jgi:adenosine deaminase
VREAIDILGVQRIDHGNRALEDPELTVRIARERLPMTVCPLSNRALKACPDLTKHPLRRMLAAGILATVNSDDPAYFGGYVNENFVAIQQALALTEDEIAVLARNSFLASFLPQQQKAAAVERFDRFRANW